MQFTSENWHDIERYYNKTYIKLGEYGDKLFYISSVSPHEIMGTTEDGELFKIKLHDTPYEVNYLLPHKGVFQLGNKSALLYRIPAKQYKRGLCSENTRVTYIDGSGEFNHPTMGFETLKQYVTKQAYPSLETAMKNECGLISVALSPFLTYVPKGHMLMIYNTKVAKLSKGVFRMECPLFLNEVAQVVEGSKFKVEA